MLLGWKETRKLTFLLFSILSRCLFCYRVRCVARDYPACRSGYDGLILKPEKSKVVDAFREIGLDDDVSRNHSAGNVGVVTPVVAVGLGLRDRTDARDI